MSIKIKLLFDDGVEGKAVTPTYEIPVSYGKETPSPYELFMSGYAACLHATFLSIVRKRRLTFANIEYDVVATKKEAVPAVLNYVETNVVIYGVEEKHQDKIIKSMKQAKEYCSISVTIQNIGAKTPLNIIFK